MFDYLVNHALKNAWCSPRQDLQVIFKPARISSPLGVKGTFNLLWGVEPLPTATDRYHVYQIGQIHPALMGLLPEQRVWHRLSTIMSANRLIGDVYTNSGLHLPRFDTWVLVTGKNDIVLAIREQPTIAALKDTTIYVRLYSNAYYHSARRNDTIDVVACNGIRYTDVNQGLTFQSEYSSWAAKPGQTWCYVNGVYVQDFIPMLLSVGDVVEYVYDASVKRVIDFPIDGLPTFDSLLDLKRKYLLHYDGAQVGGVGIDYRDDIDIYLIQKSTSSSNKPLWNGVYYHKNQDDALRQVTHRDYSTCVPYVMGYLSDRPQWTDVNQLTLRVFLRKSGYQRPLVFEGHRIQELYKLNGTQIRHALLGIDSNVTVWRADELENSAYTKLMGAYYEQIDRQLVEDAYQYNAISKILADTPQTVQSVSGRRQISLPYGLQAYSTMYEYDSSGHLLGYHFHSLGAEYTPIDSNCTLVEGIIGKGGFALSTVFGQAQTPYDPTLNYRYYIARINHGVLDNSTWQDVTGDASKYTIVNGKIVWQVDPTAWATAVKNDRDFLAYDLTVSNANGLLRFSIDAEATYPAGSAQGVMFIPVGQLDLWLNGRALIENIDYYVKWPQIVVVNKTHLVEGTVQKLTVRGTGFCKSDLSREAPGEAGFVKYGLLSRNTRFDVRDDKVLRITVNGQVHPRSDLLFSESSPDLSMVNVTNGVPYSIEYPAIPLRGLTNSDTYTLRSAAQVVDKQISDYLTAKLPEKVETNPDEIPEKYPVYSPFSSQVMYDLINGYLPMDNFQGQYSDKDVRAVLGGYTYLLDYDPTQKSVDLDHVAIHPHNLNTVTVLNIYQYNFLNRAIKIYLDNKVDITRFISIKPNWV